MEQQQQQAAPTEALLTGFDHREKISQIVAKWTGIPVNKLTRKDKVPVYSI